MKMKKITALMCTAALAASMLAGCSKNETPATSTAAPQPEQTTAASEASTEKQTEAAPAAGKILTLASPQSSASLDPTNGYDYWYTLRYGVGETLLKFDTNMVPSGWLVEDDYGVSEDKLTWTFHIKDGITFSNGNVCDAAAVKASIERQQELLAVAGNAFKAASIEADGLTLTITTEKEVPTLPYLLADPAFVIYDTSVDLSNVAEKGVICTGPFVFDSFDTISFNTSVVKNQNYWGGEVKLDGINFVINSDISAMSMALANNEVDAAYSLDVTNIQQFVDNSDFNVEITSSMRTDFCFLNQCEGKVLSDTALRQAIMRACDRDLYCSTVLSNMFVAGKTVLTSALPYGFDEIADPDAYDLDSAKKLLEDAGYKDVNGDGYVETPDGQPLEVILVSYSTRFELDSLSQAIQMSCMELGVNVTISNREQSGAWNSLTSGDFDMCFMSISMASAGDPENSLRSYFATHTEENNNYNAYGYSSETVDKLLVELSSEFDKDKRAELIKQIQTEIINDSAIFNMCYPTINFVTKVNVEGVLCHPCDYYWVDMNTCFK